MQQVAKLDGGLLGNLAFSIPDHPRTPRPAMRSNRAPMPRAAPVTTDGPSKERSRQWFQPLVKPTFPKDSEVG